MMYNEFIALTGWSEDYMTYEDYTNYIEEAYNKSQLDKKTWCNRLYRAYDRCVYTPVNMAISAHITEDKEDYVFNGNEAVMGNVKALEMQLKDAFLRAMKNSITFRIENKLS